MRRYWGLVVFVGVAIVFGIARAGAQETEPITWLALGDSYASGEGIPGTAVDSGNLQDTEDCRRANGATDARAWAIVAFEQAYPTRSLEDILFVACTGAITDDYFAQLAEAGQRWPDRMSTVDVVSLSFGGNNLRFSNVIRGCLDINSVWGFFDLTPGCDLDEERLRYRIDLLAGNSSITQEDILSGDYEGSLNLPQLYDAIAKVVRPGGRVVVTGYPQLIEETSKWDSGRRRYLHHCEGILASDVGMLRSATGYLNEQIALAVQAANQRHIGVDFVFVDLAAEVYETGDDSGARHALCSPDPWLNGRTIGITSGDWALKRSFHPYQIGHLETGWHLASGWSLAPWTPAINLVDKTVLGFSAGSPAQEVIKATVSKFGPPDGDSGWYSFCWPDDIGRFVSWPGLDLHFLGPESEGVLSGFVVRSDISAPGGPGGDDVLWLEEVSLGEPFGQVVVRVGGEPVRDYLDSDWVEVVPGVSVLADTTSDGSALIDRIWVDGVLRCS